MGQSKLPFYAYADETGNTGHNLFDEAQPDFYTAALLTRGDFDLAFGDSVKGIADKLRVPQLHGKELGMKRLAKVAPDILSILMASKAHFLVSRVEKSYLLATKVFDTFFDSGENAAVAWHHYNLRPNRLILAFKLASCIDESTAKRFWKCILEPNEEKYLAMLLEVAADLRVSLSGLKDLSARKILDEGLAWAEKHPECIQVHVDRQTARKGHFPNMVAFANLLQGLDEYSKQFRRPVARITHDRQSEFEKNLASMHELYSNASPDQLNWAGEVYSLQKVAGSTFEVKEDGESAGIQFADTLLWLFFQMRKGVNLPNECADLIRYCYINGWYSDFSFEGVGSAVDATLQKIMETPFGAEQEEHAHQLIAKAEESRQLSMRRYEEDGLAPFMRSGADRHSIVTAALLANKTIVTEEPTR
jgi:hypothetical protein